MRYGAWSWSLWVIGSSLLPGRAHLNVVQAALVVAAHAAAAALSRREAAAQPRAVGRGEERLRFAALRVVHRDEGAQAGAAVGKAPRDVARRHRGLGLEPGAAVRLVFDRDRDMAFAAAALVG